MVDALVNYSQTDDHAVPIYQNPQPINITFTISRYPSKTLGQLLKRLRLEKGLEQWELAKRLRVNKNSVCEWENDRKVPSRKSMDGLARFFGIGRNTLEEFKTERKRGLQRNRRQMSHLRRPKAPNDV